MTGGHDGHVVHGDEIDIHAVGRQPTHQLLCVLDFVDCDVRSRPDHVVLVASLAAGSDVQVRDGRVAAVFQGTSDVEIGMRDDQRPQLARKQSADEILGARHAPRY
jgi:hypothetical protein